MDQYKKNSIQELLLEGKICFYFPFKLKDKEFFRIFRKRWRSLEKRHENIVRYGRHPRTELLDRIAFVEERERVLSFAQKRIPGAIILDDCSPYATPCIKREYQHSLKDNLNAKEVSVVLSSFRLTCDTIAGRVKTTGSLLFNINLDNSIATPIIVLNFEKLSVDAIISLKHCYYKHALVHIQEFLPTETVCKNDNNCKCLLVDRQQSDASIDKGLLSMHQYIYDKIPWIIDSQTAMSYSMKYTLLEIVKPTSPQVLADPQIYGLLCADEGWRYVPEERMKGKIGDNSYRDSHNIYFHWGSGMILTDTQRLIEYKSYKNKFMGLLSHHEEHIRPLTEDVASCLPAIGKGYYPSFLKAVEISYLIYEVNSDEVSPNIKSYINPWIIIHRCYKLWKIIHEVDMNTYHHSYAVNKSFGNKDKLDDIRKEYGELLSLGINYFLAVVALLTLVATLS